MKRSKQMLTKAEVADILENVLDSIPEENNNTRQALSIAKSEMRQHKGKFSANHRYQEWSEYEDEKLLKMFREKCSISEICEFLGRTEKGISSRLVRLGKIKERKDIYKYLEK